MVKYGWVLLGHGALESATWCQESMVKYVCDFLGPGTLKSVSSQE